MLEKGWLLGFYSCQKVLAGFTHLALDSQTALAPWFLVFCSWLAGVLVFFKGGEAMGQKDLLGRDWDRPFYACEVDFVFQFEPELIIFLPSWILYRFSEFVVIACNICFEHFREGAVFVGAKDLPSFFINSIITVFIKIVVDGYWCSLLRHSEEL